MAHPGDGAYLARFARLYLAEDESPGEEKGDQCRADKDRPVRLQHRQVADPGPAETQRDQDQRPQTAGGGKDGGQTTGEKGTAPVLGFRQTLVLSILK